MKTKLLNLWRGLLHYLPEALLIFFVLSLAPAVVMVAARLRVETAKMWESPGLYWHATALNPWPAAAAFACLVGAALLLYLLWRNWMVVWAVARKMIIEAFHRKVVLILLVFFVVLMLSLPFILTTEGSPKSQLQLVMLYSLVLAMVLMSLLAIFLSAASICSEVERKHVHITDTKPLQRWKFLLGKWFGVVVMCSAVLFVMTAAACALVLFMARAPDYSRMTLREARKALQGQQELLEEVLVARKSVRAFDPPGMQASIERELKTIEQKGELPDNPRKLRALHERLRKTFLAKVLTVPPRGYYEWHFAGLTPQLEGVLHVRFRGYVNVRQGRLLGMWQVVHRKRVTTEDGKVHYRPEVVLERVAPQYGWHTDVRREFAIPSAFTTEDGQVVHVVPEDGILALRYINLDDEATASFDGNESVVIMQREGGFLANYYRALLVLVCHIALLAALGLMAGSIFSFPVASLTVVFFVVIGLAGAWFVSFAEPGVNVEYTFLQELRYAAWRTFSRSILAVMPHFGKFNPLGDLTDGKMVTWNMVAGAAAMMVFIKASAALLVGMYFYARRELARVIV